MLFRQRKKREESKNTEQNWGNFLSFCAVKLTIAPSSCYTKHLKSCLKFAPVISHPNVQVRTKVGNLGTSLVVFQHRSQRRQLPVFGQCLPWPSHQLLHSSCDKIGLNYRQASTTPSKVTLAHCTALVQQTHLPLDVIMRIWCFTFKIALVTSTFKWNCAFTFVHTVHCQILWMNPSILRLALGRQFRPAKGFVQGFAPYKYAYPTSYYDAHSNILITTTYNWNQSYRNLTINRPLFDSKDSSKVEQTVKALREEVKDKDKATAVVTPKRSLGKRVWDELVHYYHGFRLLFIDIGVASRLIWKVLNGTSLSRREHKQLVRTSSDVFRLVPFSVFIIVPFMEFLLPVFLKFFPGMLPSTFQTASSEASQQLLWLLSFLNNNFFLLWTGVKVKTTIEA